MIRIRFPTDRERVRGNYVLATKSIVRRLRGQIFEVSEAGLKLLDEHKIPYQVLRPGDTAQASNPVCQLILSPLPWWTTIVDAPPLVGGMSLIQP